MSFSADRARATVRYHVNKIVMEERLNVYVGCTTFRDIGWHTCSAGVSRTWAPQGKYNDDTFKPISRTFAVDQDWNAKLRPDCHTESSTAISDTIHEGYQADG